MRYNFHFNNSWSILTAQEVEESEHICSGILGIFALLS